MTNPIRFKSRRCPKRYRKAEDRKQVMEVGFDLHFGQAIRTHATLGDDCLGQRAERSYPDGNQFIANKRFQDQLTRFVRHV